MKNRQDSFKQKIGELKEADKDKLFLEDLKEISEYFRTVDLGKRRGANNK